MKKILLFLCFILSFVIFADVIPGGWETDISRAMQRAATEKKPIMLIISGPASDAASRILKKDVIANSNFDKAAKKYAVCLIIYTNPGKKQNKKDLKLQKTFAGIYKGTVPCYAVVDSKLKLLAIPGGKKAYDFIKTLFEERKDLSFTAAVLIGSHHIGIRFSIQNGHHLPDNLWPLLQIRVDQGDIVTAGML